MPVVLEHLGLYLEAIPEQDHDQRDVRQVRDERRAGVEVKHAGGAVAEQERDAAVGRIDDVGELLRADDERVVGRPGPDQRVGLRRWRRNSRRTPR